MQKGRFSPLSAPISITNSNDEFLFIIYETYTRNRKTMAIYRKNDGERLEVNLVLNSEKQSNIGKKINNAINKLRKMPINEVYQEFMNYKIQKVPTMNEVTLVSFPTEIKQEVSSTKIVSELQKRMINDGYIYKGLKTVFSVCAICKGHKDCYPLFHLHFCESCKANEPNFREKCIELDDLWYENNGFESPRKWNWCQYCKKAPEKCSCHIAESKEFDDHTPDQYCYNLNCPCELEKHQDAWRGKIRK
jgi:hypothetical protein